MYNSPPRAGRLRVRVRLAADRLDLELTDDGRGGAEAGEGGRGMRNMQARAEELRGAIHWLPGTLGGTKVLLSVPLAPAAGSAVAAEAP